MDGFIHHALFGIYPYIALSVFLIGSLVRFETDQYGWRSKSSQFLRRKQLVWGSILFHIGILGLLVGHTLGLLTPIGFIDWLGISHSFKQMMAIVIGGFFGSICFVGLTMLLHRRLFDTRIRKTSAPSDIAVLAILWVQLVLGMGTIPLSLDHLDGGEMVKFMAWALGIVTLQPSSSAFIADAHIIFKLHIFLGMTIFLIFPFTRLVHVWSAPASYLTRRYQLVRTKAKPAAGDEDSDLPPYVARSVFRPEPKPPVRRSKAA